MKKMLILFFLLVQVWTLAQVLSWVILDFLLMLYQKFHGVNMGVRGNKVFLGIG